MVETLAEVVAQPQGAGDAADLVLPQQEVFLAQVEDLLIAQLAGADHGEGRVFLQREGLERVHHEGDLGHAAVGPMQKRRLRYPSRMIQDKRSCERHNETPWRLRGGPRRVAEVCATARMIRAPCLTVKTLEKGRNALK